MEITVNGEPLQIGEGATASDLIGELGLAERRIALEINREVLPRSRQADHPLCPGDKVEIVHAIGGG